MWTGRPLLCGQDVWEKSKIQQSWPLLAVADVKCPPFLFYFILFSQSNRCFGLPLLFSYIDGFYVFYVLRLIY